MSHLLYKAVEKGDLSRVAELLGLGADIAWTHKGTGRTALSQAAIDGHLAIARLLIEHGADINWQDKAVGMTPLCWACSQGHAQLAEALLKAGADCDLPSREHLLSPLMVAVMDGHVAIVERLLAAGANVAAVSADGSNALGIAQDRGLQAMVERLEKAGAKPPVPLAEPATLPWPDVAQVGGVPDYTLPASVLRAFILAMHQAESEAWQAHRTSRRESVSFDFEPVLRREQEIFALYCTAKKRPYGRSGSISQPFDYEPEETLHAVEMVSASRAELVTRQAPGRAMRFENLYVLLKKQGQWRLDSKKNRFVGTPSWQPTIL